VQHAFPYALAVKRLSGYDRCSRCCAKLMPNAGTRRRAPQVLGVRSDTSSETLQRAYRKRLSEAKGDKARTAAVEEAHSRIMMSNLSARMKARADHRLLHCKTAHTVRVSSLHRRSRPAHGGEPRGAKHLAAGVG